MRSLIVLCLLEAFVLSHNTQSAPPKTEILAVWNLYEVTKCVLHYCPLVYVNYGCWCGFRGAHEPVDEIDSCCMDHKKCYEAAVSGKTCALLLTYLDNYNFKCTNGTAVCSEHNKPCPSALCACDVTFAECLSNYPKPQEKKNCTYESEMSKGILEHFQQ